MLHKFFYGFALAWSMLTAIPFVKVKTFYSGINGYAVIFYPLVGWIVGMFLVGLFILGQDRVPQSYLYVIVFVAWVVATGALHLDGVADVFDALFVPKERREAVLKDPHIGAMGMIFTLLFILLKLFAFMQAELIYLLPVVLMLSRFNAVAAIYFFDYIRKDGMGSLAKAELHTWQFIFSAFIVVAIAVLYSWQVTLGMLVLLFLPLFLVAWLARKAFGGFSGDLYGLLIEVTEWVLLHILMFGYLGEALSF